MEEWIYSNTYRDNQLVIDRMKENVEYAVRRLASHLDHNYPMNYVDQLAISNIRESINNKSEREQAFEIIKEKGVDVGEFKKDFVYDKYEYAFYLDYCKHFSVEKLTREEYDLLKEVLANDC